MIKPPGVQGRRRGVPRSASAQPVVVNAVAAVVGTEAAALARIRSSASASVKATCVAPK